MVRERLAPARTADGGEGDGVRDVERRARAHADVAARVDPIKTALATLEAGGLGGARHDGARAQVPEARGLVIGRDVHEIAHRDAGELVALARLQIRRRGPLGLGLGRGRGLGGEREGARAERRRGHGRIRPLDRAARRLVRRATRDERDERDERKGERDDTRSRHLVLGRSARVHGGDYTRSSRDARGLPAEQEGGFFVLPEGLRICYLDVAWIPSPTGRGCCSLRLVTVRCCRSRRRAHARGVFRRSTSTSSCPRRRGTR